MMDEQKNFPIFLIHLHFFDGLFSIILFWRRYIVIYCGNYYSREVFDCYLSRFKDAFLSYCCSSSPEPISDALISTNSGRFRGELFPSLQLSLKSDTLIVQTL